MTRALRVGLAKILGCGILCCGILRCGILRCGILLKGIVLSGFLLHGPAQAGGDGDPTGLDLLYRCHTSEQLARDPAAAADAELMRDNGYCLGYLVGYVSGFAARDAGGAEQRFCPPVNARIADFALAIRDWLTANPAGLEQIGALVTLRALQAKFPCPEEVKRDSAQ